MNTEAIFNAAQSTAIKLIESGAFIPPDSTVCAVQSLSGRIYTGVSHPEMNNGMQTLVHAEVDAVRNMLAANDNGIEAMLLINTQSRMPMLPCPNCIGYILSLDPRNQNCAVMMQDRMLNINEAGMYAAPQ
jgi:cytidine deaminase